MEIYLLLFFILILAIFLGLELISKIPSTLHTPLMSGANAFAPDIKGVCRVLGIFEINSNPKKIANIKIKNRSRYISIT